MQPRHVIAAFGVVGVGALALTQMGNYSQDRQYKKTLAYMHDGRDKIAKKMEDAQASVSNAVSGKK